MLHVCVMPYCVHAPGEGAACNPAFARVVLHQEMVPPARTVHVCILPRTRIMLQTCMQLGLVVARRGRLIHVE